MASIEPSGQAPAREQGAARAPGDSGAFSILTAAAKVGAVVGATAGCYLALFASLAVDAPSVFEVTRAGILIIACATAIGAAAFASLAGLVLTALTAMNTRADRRGGILKSAGLLLVVLVLASYVVVLQAMVRRD